MEAAVRRVASRRDLDRFIDFPTRLHAGDKARVPPLRAVLRRRLRGALDEGSNRQLFLAERAGEVVGTISLLRDRKHEQHRGEVIGFFGFFECVDELEVARALLDAVSAAAREFGAERLRGPRNFSRVEAVGVTVEGHDVPPPMLAGHSPAWYPALLEACGMVLHHDVLAFDAALVTESGAPRELPRELSSRADAVAIDGLVVRDANRWRVSRDLKLAHAVFTDAFRDVPDNTPMPLRQFVAIGWVFLAVTDHRMLQIATVHGEPAGFALCFPELNEAVARAKGRLFPFGWLRILLGVRRVRTASFKLIGVMPAFRGSGLHAAMIRRAIDGVQRAGFQRLEASLIDARNKPSRGLVEASGMTVYKRYRMYDLDLSTEQ